MQGAIIFLIIFVVLIVLAVVMPAAFKSIFTNIDSGNLFGVSGASTLLKSVDGGETWKIFDHIVFSGRITRFVEHPDKADIVFIGLQNGGLIKSEDGGDTFVPIIGGEIGAKSTVYDLYFGNYQGNQALYVAVFQEGIGSLLVSENMQEFKRLYIAPIANVGVFASAQHPFDGRLFVGTAQGGFLESDNYGESWRLVRWFPGAISLIKINPRSAEIFVYTNQERLFRSVDGGATWVEITNELSNNSQKAKEITVIAFHPHATSTVYAGSGFGLLRSLSGGATWSLVRSGVAPESLPIRNIDFFDRQSGDIYMVAGTQLHISHDEGVSWRSIQLPIKQTLMHLYINQNNKDIIYVAT